MRSCENDAHGVSDQLGVRLYMEDAWRAKLATIGMRWGRCVALLADQVPTCTMVWRAGQQRHTRDSKCKCEHMDMAWIDGTGSM